MYWKLVINLKFNFAFYTCQPINISSKLFRTQIEPKEINFHLRF